MKFSKEIIKVFKGLEFETYEWDVYYDGKLQINCDTMNTYLENILKQSKNPQINEISKILSRYSVDVSGNVVAKFN